jgi:hypothetical protein
MRYIRGVNMLYVDNLGPPGIGETPSKFQWTLIQPQWIDIEKKINHSVYQLTWERCFILKMRMLHLTTKKALTKTQVIISLTNKQNWSHHCRSRIFSPNSMVNIYIQQSQCLSLTQRHKLSWTQVKPITNARQMIRIPSEM